MITVKTDTSRISDADGNLASGTITLWPNVSFQYLADGTDPIKVTTRKRSFNFTDGLLNDDFDLHPTYGPSHDPQIGVYFNVVYQFAGEPTPTIQDKWAIDQNGAAELEITEVQRVGVPTPPPASILTYTFDKTSAPASVWTIPHPLGRFPSVTIVDSGGIVVAPQEVKYLNQSTIQVTFASAFAGKAYLN